MLQTQDAALVRTMRPLLNRWLGGFGDALSSGSQDGSVGKGVGVLAKICHLHAWMKFQL